MRRAVALGLALALSALASPTAAQQADPADLAAPPQPVVATVPDGWPGAPSITADAYLLLDAETGQVLAEQAADARLPVASTVKVLTALSALRRTEPTDVVTVGREVVGIGGASVGLRPGDEVSVTDLLEAIVARSGNDAAVALAHHVGGSVPGFLELMRQDARALGLEGVTLVTPSGLEDRNRLSARDLGVISRAALREPAFREVAALPAVTLPRAGTVPSRNELLGRYPGATGVKTGYTQAAGYTLIASAQRGDRHLLAVVLGADGADARFTDAAALLDHGFDTFVPAVVRPDVRLRVAGGWIPTEVELPRVLVPAREPTVDVDVTLPVRPGRTGTVDVAWNGTTLIDDAVLASAAEARGASKPAGPAAIGRWLWDRAYEGLRAESGR